MSLQFDLQFGDDFLLVESRLIGLFVFNPETLHLLSEEVVFALQDFDFGLLFSIDIFKVHFGLADFLILSLQFFEFG